ncbi:MAG TPA: dipeptide epimerase [Woeseiaceae bacterium]|nr:dipeptide epimerase [Woeseiaceae bacterium]
MSTGGARRRTLSCRAEALPLAAPFRISGHTFTSANVLVVTLEAGGATGRGEASGVYYFDETPESMRAQVEACREALEGGASREEVQALLPPGGARNAVDCALWELEALLAGRSVWELAGVDVLAPLVTTFTLGAEDPAVMVQRAQGFADARALKLKLTGDVDLDGERVRAVRDARPEVWLGVDANQGFTPDALDALMPVLLACRVSLVEQPFPRGREADLDGLERPIPVAADESVLTAADVAALAGRFDVVNIKLDKCGGLTAALEMADECRRAGLSVMVGNMVGSSWAMVPSMIVGQRSDVVDLDGPALLARDRVPGVRYEGGRIVCPPGVWGGAAGPEGR